MPRGQRSLKRERIRALLRTDGSRFVEIGARLRVFRCTCNQSHVTWPKDKPHPETQFFAAPAELATEKVWGGRYDTVLRRYTGEQPTKVVDLPCHEGQVQLLTLTGDDAYGRPLDSPEVLRILALGSPGAGKTLAAVTRALLMALERPNTTGGLVAPIGDSRAILWEGFEEVCPATWIKSSQPSKKTITLVNNTRIQILSAKASSKQTGSPLKGRSWDWAVVDEAQSIEDSSHAQIATRGRRAGGKYRIFETATNDGDIPPFRVRLETIKANRLNRRINFTGFQNPWVVPEFWHKLRGDFSDRAWREQILAEDVPPERLVYPRFSMQQNVSRCGVLPARPDGLEDPAKYWLNDLERKRLGKLRDVTEKLTFERFNVASKFIIAQDFGVLINAAEVLKVFQAETGELFWWAIDEITSGGGTDLHAYKLKNYYDPSECVVIADPHFNSKESDKSDYNIMREQGWETFPATHGKISVKHRIAMFNALLEDADGRRRFFVDCDSNGTPKCTRLVRSLVSSELNDHGEAEKDRKNGASDPSHWPSAVQFGLFHWEKKRGSGEIKSLGGDTKKKWWEEA